MYTAGAKVDLDFSLRLQILRVKRNLLLLLLTPGLNQQRIAKIIVMEMKRRLVVPISIGLHDLAVGDSRILHEHVYICTALPIRPAHKAFDRKSVISFMRCRNDRWETAHHGYGQDPLPPLRLILCDLSMPHELWTDVFFGRRTLASGSHCRKSDQQ